MEPRKKFTSAPNGQVESPYKDPAEGLGRALAGILSLQDFEARARRRLPAPVFGYISGAAEDNRSLDANRTAFASHMLVPRILRDVGTRNLRTPFLGTTWAAPFGIAPMGMAALAAYRGDVALACAAAEAGLPSAMSGTSLMPLEDVAKAAPESWFQAYVPGSLDAIDGLVGRAERAGYTTLVVTVDVPVAANRENLIRVGFQMPFRPTLGLALQGALHPRWTIGTFLRTLMTSGMPHFENAGAERGAPVLSRSATRTFGGRERLDWSHIAHIRKRWPGKLVIKGILSAADARLAAEQGADAIIVSNHGGRQLDGAVPPLLVLPGIVAAVPDLPVALDSGIRRGTDVIVALALGARFVFVGRPFLYAAVVGGQAGVALAIELLRSEIDRNLAMLGLSDIAQIDGSILHTS